MNYSLGVGRRQSARNLHGIVKALADRQHANPQPVAQRLAIQKFRDNVGRIAVSPHVIDGQNVGVI